MFKKIKSFVKGVCSKAKSTYENTEAKIKAKVIKLLVGIRAEAYVKEKLQCSKSCYSYTKLNR